MPQKNLYAVLIGINHYEAVNRLNGCVKDILNIDAILRKICVSQIASSITYHPLYLLSPRDGDTSIQDYQQEHGLSFDYHAPDFVNVTQKAFDHLGNASDEDICLFYFSGHGSTMQMPPGFRPDKGNPQWETIVCSDSRKPGVRMW
ncbi:caspase family protein [Chitinophaga pinensis]|uniref:Caspase family protein n=1 Tax=Chitinophaga pinensis TaxID=79329 RepID=A0A5C6LL84_9BACT|nr:caspase family protein [Chitinophaga pinensis]TWV93954.1 caspase family protein [Chitinophaga pinensis]